MNRLTWLGLLFLVILVWSGAAFAFQRSTNQELIESQMGTGATNLLYNPSFEGEYHAYIPPGGHPDCPFGVCITAQMADGWTPWWVSHDPQDENHIIRMPEYKPAAPWENRIRSGANAQQYFSFFSTHRAGIYQRVSVKPDHQYRFAIWGHAWESYEDNPDYSDPTGYPINQQIGIDPTGGTNWSSPKVVWSTPHGQYDKFGLFQVCAVAQKSTITVFTFSEPKWAAKHNDVYWDDAELIEYNQPCKTDMTISADRGVAFLTEPGLQVLPMSVQVNTPVDPQVSWTASTDGGGTILPNIQSGTGLDGESFKLSVDSIEKPTGLYSGTVTVTSTPPVIGSPVTFTVTLVVAPEIYNFYLPGVIKQ
jgi:hypothetical protein